MEKGLRCTLLLVRSPARSDDPVTRNTRYRVPPGRQGASKNLRGRLLLQPRKVRIRREAQRPKPNREAATPPSPTAHPPPARQSDISIRSTLRMSCIARATPASSPAAHSPTRLASVRSCGNASAASPRSLPPASGSGTRSESCRRQGRAFPPELFPRHESFPLAVRSQIPLFDPRAPRPK